MTALFRLLDVVTVFEADTRVQLVFSKAGSSPFQGGVDDLLRDLGMIAIPWSQAINTPFDLAIAASYSGLTDLTTPVVVLSHGGGFAKNSPVSEVLDGSGKRSVYGLSPERLIYDGLPIASSLILSHEEQLHRLGSITPAALPTAVVVGDPCYDQILRSLHLRNQYREKLGMRSNQKLISVSTTWCGKSLMGSWPSVFQELLACAPSDDIRFAALIHPNILHGHGSWQVRAWLADSVRSGMVLAPELDGWKAMLIASDLIVGDHGVVTCYGAALGVPVLLAAFPDEDVASGSAVDLLGRVAPRMDRRNDLSSQIHAAINTHDAERFGEVRDLISSYPGEAASRLRQLFYGYLRLPEPRGSATVPVVPVSRIDDPVHTSGRADYVNCTLNEAGPSRVRIARYPAYASVNLLTSQQPGRTHLAVHEDCANPSLLQQADVVVINCSNVDDPNERMLSAIPLYPQAALIAVVSGTFCLVRTVDGIEAELNCEEPMIAASFVHTWNLEWRTGILLRGTIVVLVGSREVSIHIISVSM
ncbi:hypothetical protein JOD54_005690 [Actinokineospora baliensis]|uniref:hypothetical protein n=1 Tax=Actinokineospora baliensis TaxID=547056 RepID=UPI001958B81F|nr:hypothetical protein [Actinokineospora baliensis]MBM7775486.1 hypothetical protein [Actinokineospora baliensis]